MGSSSENSHNLKHSSITSHDDDGRFMASFRNLGLTNFQGTSLNNNFGVGSSSCSASSEQGSQKGEIFYGGQVNGALEKRPVDSCVSETSSESPIFQDNLWAYHNSINGDTQKAKSPVRPSDDHGGLLDLKQYGFLETTLEMTTSANNPSSLALSESDDGITKAPLNPISSNNTQTESKSDFAPGNLMGSTNYTTCLNKDCYKCSSFMDISDSGSTCDLGIGSFMLNGGNFLSPMNYPMCLNKDCYKCWSILDSDCGYTHSFGIRNYKLNIENFSGARQN